MQSNFRTCSTPYQLANGLGCSWHLGTHPSRCPADAALGEPTGSGPRPASHRSQTTGRVKHCPFRVFIDRTTFSGGEQLPFGEKNPAICVPASLNGVGLAVVLGNLGHPRHDIEDTSDDLRVGTHPTRCPGNLLPWAFPTQPTPRLPTTPRRWRLVVLSQLPPELLHQARCHEPVLGSTLLACHPPGTSRVAPKSIPPPTRSLSALTQQHISSAREPLIPTHHGGVCSQPFFGCALRTPTSSASCAAITRVPLPSPPSSPSLESCRQKCVFPGSPISCTA